MFHGVGFRIVKFHVIRRLLKRCESELGVQAVSVACHQAPSPQSLQMGMAHDALHQPLPQPVPSAGFQNKHIAKVSIRGVVGNHTSKTYLLSIVIDAKAKRILDRARHNLPRYSFGPIRRRQKTVDDIQIDSCLVSTDNEFALAMFCDRCLASVHSVAILA